MKNKSKSKTSFKEQKEARRIAKLENEGRIVDGIEIPEDSIPADPLKQNNKFGYATHRFYQDKHYICEGCGINAVWTKEQQKKYYEVQKGNIYNQAKWCHACHSKRMQGKQRK